MLHTQCTSSRIRVGEVASRWNCRHSACPAELLRPNNARCSSLLESRLAPVLLNLCSVHLRGTVLLHWRMRGIEHLYTGLLFYIFVDVIGLLNLCKIGMFPFLPPAVDVTGIKSNSNLKLPIVYSFAIVLINCPLSARLSGESHNQNTK
jgi:hypothetical protein